MVVTITFGNIEKCLPSELKRTDYNPKDLVGAETCAHDFSAILEACGLCLRYEIFDYLDLYIYVERRYTLPTWRQNRINWMKSFLLHMGLHKLELFSKSPRLCRRTVVCSQHHSESTLLELILRRKIISLYQDPSNSRTWPPFDSFMPYLRRYLVQFSNSPFSPIDVYYDETLCDDRVRIVDETLLV